MQHIILLIFSIFSWSLLPAHARDSAPAVFYPLPTLVQGKTFIAQNLFLGDEGGLWIHDVHGNVMFFDGQTMLPKQGSLFRDKQQQLAYAQGRFWTFIDNELYQTRPGSESELVLSLTPGVSIEKIGASNGYIWLSDGAYFYTYHLQTKQLKIYSLAKLYQLNQASQVEINDAELVHYKWVLATNVGTYISEAQAFSHIRPSGKNPVQTLYFSPQKNHLLVGTHKGALLIDIFHSEYPLKKIGDGQVFAIIEAEGEYWIGSDKGLFVYSLATEKTTQLISNGQGPYGLPEGRIYALANDQHGGIWIATHQGIRYFSLFSQKFTRYLADDITHERLNSKLKRLRPIPSSNQYLMVTQDGLYLFDGQQQGKKSLVYSGQINDVLLLEDQLWIASEQGLILRSFKQNRDQPEPLPFILRHSPIQHLTVDNEGRLWGVSNNQLWSYHPDSQHYTDFGHNWLLDNKQDIAVTALYSSREHGLLIGTRHGIYTLRNGQITYDKRTANYGTNLGISETATGEVWFVSERGVFRRLNDQLSLFAVPLIDDNIRLKCLVNSGQGMWLASSKGLTLYHADGSIDKHFGSPHGLINNELESGVCSASYTQEQILFSSMFGLLAIQTTPLANAEPPHSSLIFSQVSINYQPIQIGGATLVPLHVAYGQAISFQFGALPDARGQALEFSLNNDPWQRFEGPQLTLDHLLPGHYTLSLRHIGEERVDKTLNFQVLKPWYFSNWAIVGYASSLLLVGGLLTGWRSRVMDRVNQDLKQQIADKTRQLQQQSKMLLSHNLLLRKQIQIRHLWLERWQRQNQPLLKQLSVQTHQHHSPEMTALIDQLTEQIVQIGAFNSSGESMTISCSLSLVLETVLHGWHSEFARANIKIDYHPSDLLPDVLVKQAGLDVIFNALLSDALKRLYAHQTLTIETIEREGHVVVLIKDYGSASGLLDKLMVISNGNVQFSLDELVALSGGNLSIHSSSERNLIELMWPQVISVESTPAALLSAKPQSDSELEWLRKLNHIVAERYADAEFTTSDIAKRMYLSERSLQRRMKYLTGKTFKEYLTEYRLEQACSLLMSGEKVAQVAFLCGFNDPSYFSQRFKHQYGLSPSQFAEESQ